MVKDNTNPLRQEKIRKRQELLDKGIDPYPHNWNQKRTSSFKISQDFSQLKAGESDSKTIFIAGRLMRKRPMGKTAFFNIQDEKGELQCYIRRDDFSDTVTSNDVNCKKPPAQNDNPKLELSPWALWKLCDIGDILGLSGVIFKSQKGELSLRIQNLSMLCKTLESLPEKYHGLEDKELKYRYRHLDLIMDCKSRQVFKTRSQVIHEIRSFMHQAGFMEVETPILQPVYGGAIAQPFETYFRRLNQKMYLKISPEIYLKKLIVGGFEKVFEVGKNFRNEGLDRSHNPEFTMLEYYEAYTDYKQQMKRFENLICHVIKKIKGSLDFEYQGRKLNFNPPWEKLTVRELVQKHNSTSPLKDLDKISCEDLFNYVLTLEAQIDLEKFKKVLSLKKQDYKEQLEDLKDELILLVFEETVEKHLWNPIFVTDFPLVVSPLTKQHRTNRRLAERFEPYIAGMELGNAYSELNDPMDQRQRLENQQRWSKDQTKPGLLGDSKSKKSDTATLATNEPGNASHPIDENFLHALEVGMPPTGGVGLGIERLVMILTDQKHIKDSMLFPTLKDKL